MRNYSAYREWWGKKDRGERQGETDRPARGVDKLRLGSKAFITLSFFYFSNSIPCTYSRSRFNIFQGLFWEFACHKFWHCIFVLGFACARLCARNKLPLSKRKSSSSFGFPGTERAAQVFSHIDYCAFFWVNPVWFEKNSWGRLVVKFLSSRGRPCNPSGKTWKSTKLELWGAIWSSPH